MELFKASTQWANRPDDERFSSLEDMHEQTLKYKNNAATSVVKLDTLRVEADQGEIKMIGKNSIPARFTNWSFGQMATKIGAPANYLRNLPATLASQNINHGLKKLSENGAGTSSLMFHQNGDLLLRSMTSEKYTRIWNHEIVERILPMKNHGWRVPPARPARGNQPGARQATQEDILNQDAHGGLSIKEGDWIAPAGLYASDHDMFVFMVNDDKRVKDGTDEGLAKGFFCWNSEVGAATFGVTAFFYRHVCGNHIVWGAKDVTTIKVRHIGTADRTAFRHLEIELKKYADSSVSDVEAKIESAKRFQLGTTKEEVLDALFKTKLAGRKVFNTAYDIAEENIDTDGSPYSAWGISQGMTRLSQSLPYADERNKLDRAAGKVMEIAF